jgi:hypothetical protein
MDINSEQNVQVMPMSQLLQLDVQLPPFQRVLDEGRVTRYCRENRERHPRPVLQTGILLLRVQDSQDSTWYLPDGQHRWTTFKRMLQEDGVDVPVLVIFTTCPSQRDLYSVYRFVNDAFPLEVPLTEEECGMAREVAVTLNNQWPAAFSTAGKPRRPNISQNALAEALAEIVAKFGSVDELVKRVTHFNNVQCPKLPDKAFKAHGEKQADVKRLRKLALKKLCYLGLFPSHRCWINLMMTTG